MVRDLEGVVSFYKIGYQLVFAGGLDFARELASGGTQVFLDMKLLDIDNTVAKGVENIVSDGRLDADAARLSQGDARGGRGGEGIGPHACSP